MRAITRIATPATEEYLLEIARDGTAAHLEKVVRGFRRSEAIREASGATERHEKRHLLWYYDEADGSLIIRGRLSPEEGAVVVKALEAAAEGLNESGPAEPLSCGGDLPPDPQPGSDITVENRFAAARADALVVLADSFLASGAVGRTSADRNQVVVHVDVQMLTSDEGDLCETEDGIGLSGETARRLACDASIVRLIEKDGEPLTLGRKTRSISPALRRALKARDKCCRFPGCTNKTYVDGHHMLHWGKDGPTNLDNLTLLCRFHHRLVHEGGYRVEGDPGQNLVFRRPSGQVVPPIHQTSAEGPSLVARNAGLGIVIDERTCLTSWDGGPCDYGTAVDSLYWLEDHPERNN